MTSEKSCLAADFISPVYEISEIIGSVMQHHLISDVQAIIEFQNEAKAAATATRANAIKCNFVEI